LIVSEVVTTEALINLLERKGIIDRDELLDEIRKVNEERMKGM